MPMHILYNVFFSEGSKFCDPAFRLFVKIKMYIFAYSRDCVCTSAINMGVAVEWLGQNVILAFTKT